MNSVHKIFAQDLLNEVSALKITNQIIQEAINKCASDIHLEPLQNHYQIRLRIDGILYKTTTFNHELAALCCSCLKIMSNLDIAEKRLPQDGRFIFKLNNTKNFDCRISTCPMLFGEKVVVRILNPKNSALKIEELGLNTQQLELVKNALKHPHGLILVTGPTGSGKTVTLYSALTFLNVLERNISTVEDPIEIYLPGINQVAVNPKIGLTFANVLRTFMRQDPDIIMLGEIRDRESAEIAIHAAQTGHLVLATLHTNTAVESLTRLLNIGIPRYNLATSIVLIIAQRLVRILCPHCKQRTSENFYQATGCENCTSGYQGRTGIFEVLAISQNIKQLIIDECNTLQIAEAASKQGMLDLKSSARNKALQGEISLDEINRIIGIQNYVD